MSDKASEAKKAYAELERFRPSKWYSFYKQLQLTRHRQESLQQVQDLITASSSPTDFADSERIRIGGMTSSDVSKWDKQVLIVRQLTKAQQSNDNAMELYLCGQEFSKLWQMFSAAWKKLQAKQSRILRKYAIRKYKATSDAQKTNLEKQKQKELQQECPILCKYTMKTMFNSAKDNDSAQASPMFIVTGMKYSPFMRTIRAFDCMCALEKTKARLAPQHLLAQMTKTNLLDLFRHMVDSKKTIMTQGMMTKWGPKTMTLAKVANALQIATPKKKRRKPNQSTSANKSRKTKSSMGTKRKQDVFVDQFDFDVDSYDAAKDKQGDQEQESEDEFVEEKSDVQIINKKRKKRSSPPLPVPARPSITSASFALSQAAVAQNTASINDSDHSLDSVQQHSHKKTSSALLNQYLGPNNTNLDIFKLIRARRWSNDNKLRISIQWHRKFAALTLAQRAKNDWFLFVHHLINDADFPVYSAPAYYAFHKLMKWTNNKYFQAKHSDFSLDVAAKLVETCAKFIDLKFDCLRVSRTLTKDQHLDLAKSAWKEIENNETDSSSSKKDKVSGKKRKRDE